MRVYIITSAKFEECYIEEWVKYHLNMGFDKIIIFCNTVATKNSARLGYYPGTKDEKLLDSQIGNLLSSRMGGRIIVEKMINDELSKMGD